MFNQQQKIVCTKCHSEDVYIEEPELQKLPNEITIDEMVNNRMQNLVYHPTTWKCKKCGYSITN